MVIAARVAELAVEAVIVVELVVNAVADGTDAVMTAEWVVDSVMVVGAEVVEEYKPAASDYHQKISQQMNCQNCSH